jgi:hypothetical protein
MTTDKNTLRAQLDTNRQAMINYVNALSDEQFTAQPNGKWSAGETLQHLFLSTRALNRALSSPREFFDQWPRADRPSRSSDEVIAAYHAALAGLTAAAPTSVLPRTEDLENRAEVTERFDSITLALLSTLDNWTEADLDQYQVPHPRLGLLTVREFFQFSAYHILHHLEPMRARLG